MRLRAWHVFFGVIILTHILSWRSDLFYSFSEQYFKVMASALACFILGYWPGAWVFLQLHGGHLLLKFTQINIKTTTKSRIFITMFWLFFLLGVFDRFIAYGPKFFFPEIVMKYRINMTIEGGKSVIPWLSLGNFFIFMMPSYLISIGNIFKNGRTPIIIILAVIFNIYISSSRSALFVSTLTAFYFWIIPKRITLSTVYRIFIYAMALLVGFEIIGAVVGKSSSELGFIVYAAAPLHAFDAMLCGHKILDGYLLSFAPLHYILSMFLNFTLPTSLPNIFTPLQSNVYTMFGVYYNDYGEIGLFAMLFIIGLISGSLQKIYDLSEKELIRTWSAINMTILTLSIFYDYYTTSGIIWMSIFLSPLFFSNCLDHQHKPRPQIK